MERERERERGGRERVRVRVRKRGGEGKERIEEDGERGHCLWLFLQEGHQKWRRNNAMH